MRVERDDDGKLRVAKGDNSGLGGQYAPEDDVFIVRRNQQIMDELSEEEASNEEPGMSLWKKHYPSFLMAGGGVAAALPGAFAGVFNGLSLVGLMLVGGSIIVMGYRESR